MYGICRMSSNSMPYPFSSQTNQFCSQVHVFLLSQPRACSHRPKTRGTAKLILDGSTGGGSAPCTENFQESPRNTHFFDGSLFAVYNEDENYDEIIEWVPETFGGLWVYVTFHSPFTPSVQDKEFSSKNAGLARGAKDTTVHDEGSSAFKDASSTTKGADTSADDERETVPEPGQQIYIHGPKYGETPSSVEDFGSPLYMYAKGAMGVRIRLKEEIFLTTTTHTSLIYMELCKKSWMKSSLLNRIFTAAAPINSNEPWKTDVWWGPEEGDRTKIGTIVRTFDPNASSKYPRGYMHDLSLIRPNGDVPMCYPPLTWNDEPLSLYYGRSIRLLSSTQAPISDGSSIPSPWGATIGQSISRLVINNKEVSSDVSEQFARSYLWRTHGVFRSLQGWSGAPLTVRDNQARTSVFGFQNWEWTQSKNYWGEEHGDLNKLRNLTPEELIEVLGKWGEHPFYGSFFLPSEITSSEIMWTKTKRA
ncbi:hypothetical protein FN846DRAFT_641471 [Sphaerosporella brunnea]|uniref:Uncharacterized protein n=1 Tax=Sphaerosporella brunnea TaxID=1250544 RepID=A0A5J5EB82_9PEZI|nr:hypothetical protein FN846DRAFT_641471 [Sphaerosporella brunnea]